MYTECRSYGSFSLNPDFKRKSRRAGIAMSQPQNFWRQPSPWQCIELCKVKVKLANKSPAMYKAYQRASGASPRMVMWAAATKL
jgi:hypothetical protein